MDIDFESFEYFRNITGPNAAAFTRHTGDMTRFYHQGNIANNVAVLERVKVCASYFRNEGVIDIRHIVAFMFRNHEDGTKFYNWFQYLYGATLRADLHQVLIDGIPQLIRGFYTGWIITDLNPAYWCLPNVWRANHPEGAMYLPFLYISSEFNYLRPPGFEAYVRALPGLRNFDREDEVFLHALALINDIRAGLNLDPIM